MLTARCESPGGFYKNGARRRHGSGNSEASAAIRTISACTRFPPYGNYLIVDHGGGFSTLYAHCTSIPVSVGDTVTKGQTIAYVGTTGWSTGYHLHFEIRRNGAHTNPLNYL